jgi:hypothetical protein
MWSRLQADSAFARGAIDPALLIERFVTRSARMSDWLRQQALACGLPYVALSGLESPHDVSSTCLEALGMRPPNIALQVRRPERRAPECESSTDGPRSERDRAIRRVLG